VNQVDSSDLSDLSEEVKRRKDRDVNVNFERETNLSQLVFESHFVSLLSRDHQ